MNNKIICGFAGIGKSYLAKNNIGYVDLESTPFKKNWDIYIDVAIHMQKNGYTPLLSCHQDLRRLLKKKKVKYIVIIPNRNDKKEYIERYKKRGNDNNFIKLFEDNWEKFIDEILNEEKNILILNKKYLCQNIIKI